MPEFLQRMIEERNELKDKIDRLTKFLQEGADKHTNVSVQQWVFMEQQHEFMQRYYNVLCTRIGDLV